MKKFGKRLAIVLVMMMIFTSFEFVGVFADDNPASEPVVTEESGNGDIDAPDAVDVDSDVNAETPSVKAPLRDGGVTPEDLAIEDLKLLAGNNCVVLRWKKIDIEGVDVDYYVDGEKVAVSAYTLSPTVAQTGDYVMYAISKPVSDNVSLPEYSFTVQAKAGDVEGVAVTSNNRAPVRTIAYRFTVKKGTTLKKHGGSGPSKYKLKKGQTVISYGFGGGGCYMFKYNGSIFYCAKIRAKKPTAIYRTDWNYTPEEAELFLNQRGVGSGSSVYLWCNSYTQHFYFMIGSKGNWTCYDNWECSTGKPSSPTPTGMYGVKSITGKWKKHHNIKWWSKFSGTNSVHGQKKGWTFGRPKSNGCIRNPVAKAERVYHCAPKGTGLLIF